MKTCKKHGKLSESEVRPHVNKASGKIYYDCTQCDREYARKWSKDNRPRINKRRKETYKSIAKVLPDGFVKECQHHGLLTIDEVTVPSTGRVKYECIKCRRASCVLSNERRKVETALLDDNYVIQLIQEGGGRGEKKKLTLTPADIRKFPELIKAKRAILQIKREIKKNLDSAKVGPQQPQNFEHSRVNVKKAIAASTAKRVAQTHCKNGHPLNEVRKCPVCAYAHRCKRKGHLPRAIAAKTLVDMACCSCGVMIQGSKLANRKKCDACKKKYMHKYDAARSGRNRTVNEKH